jgi:hypothetical protein
MTKKERVEMVHNIDINILMLAVVYKGIVIPIYYTFCLAHRMGEWQHENVKPIKIKKHQRLLKSNFKSVLDLLHSSLIHLNCQRSSVKQLFPHIEIKYDFQYG